MSARYIQALIQLDWLLAALEQFLERQPDGTLVDGGSVATLPHDRHPSSDEVAAALDALSHLGVLERRGRRHQLRRSVLDETAGYRRGVRDALRVTATQAAVPVSVCAALPTDLAADAAAELRSLTIDLRGALVDLITSARRRIVLASPFWDAQTADDLAVYLERRLASGVAADLLGRFGGADTGWTVLHRRLATFSTCRFFSWYEPSSRDRFGAQTFHFKAVVADDGARAYVGSANLTESGLRSRMELGVVLTGSPAIQVAGVVDATLAQFARRLSF